MSLLSIDVPFLTTNDLLEVSDSVPGPGPDGEIFSELQKFNAIVPSEAFAPQDMFALKESITTKLTELNTNELSAVGNLSSSIAALDTSQLSTVLFDSGVDVESFSLDTFDLSVEGLIDLGAGIDEFNNAIAGGCEVVLAALAASKTPKELSLESFDLSDLESSISGAITNVVDGITEFASDLDPETIAAQAEKTVTDLINETVNTVENITDSIIDTLDDLESVDTVGIQANIEAQAEAIAAEFKASVDTLLGGVQSALADTIQITEGCGIHTAKSTEALVKNLQKNVDALADKVEVSELNLLPTQKLLTEKLERVKGLVTDTQNKKLVTMTAAVVKKAQENNPQAAPKEIEQIVKNQIAKANKTHDEKIRTERECISKRVNSASSTYADMQRASNQRSASSAAGGRPVANKGSIIKEVIKWSGDNKLYDASYFKGRYAKDTAAKVNTLHPKIRERFANAIRDVQNDPEVLAMNGTARYSFATRSFAQQADLYRKHRRGGPLAAKPGNSWHNYGCACDVVFIVNGKAKWSAKYYTGIIRKHFVKYNLENVIDNDSGHFQPVEFRAKGFESAWRIKKFAIKNGTVDQNVVASYIT